MPLVMKQVFHCPDKSFGRPLSIVLEVISRIPFKDVDDMSLFQQLLLTADGRGDGSQNRCARTLLAVAETEIESIGLRLMNSGIVEPILIPHRRRGGNDCIEGLV